MSNIIIEGHPVASFELFDLQSWNTMVNFYHRKRAGIAKAFRAEGFQMAYNLKQELKAWGVKDEFLVTRALVIVKVMPPTEEISDIHNVCIKHTLDGFTDAKLWPDDEWAFIPVVVFMWAGTDNNPEYRKKAKYRQQKRRKVACRRTVIEVHRLDNLIINDQFQILPLGRTRII